MVPWTVLPYTYHGRAINSLRPAGLVKRPEAGHERVGEGGQGLDSLPSLEARPLSHCMYELKRSACGFCFFFRVQRLSAS